MTVRTPVTVEDSPGTAIITYDSTDVDYDDGDFTYNGAGYPLEADDLVLNVQVYKYGEATPIDIATSCTQISITRGRSRQLDSYQAGTCSITVRNEDRKFDPLNTASPLYRAIEPTRLVVIRVNGTVVYAGYVEDVNVDYDISGTSTAQIELVDATASLATQSLVDALDRDDEKSGVRITAMLNDAQIDFVCTGVDISTGDETVNADLVDGNLLEYIRKIERTERGYLFIDRLGRLLYRARSYTFENPGEVTFTDGGTDVPYTTIAQRSGVDLFYNRVTFNGPFLTDPQIAEDTFSQQIYRLREYKETDMLYITDARALAVAEEALKLYGKIRPSVSNVAVPINILTASDRQRVMALDLADTVIVQFTPPGYGIPASISQKLVIDGINHDWSVGSIWTSQYTLALYEANDTATLDDPVLGILDAGNVLG